MAKLPTRDDLGALPSARTGRVVSSWDASPLRRGANALSRAYESLGGSLSQIGADWEAVSQKEEAHDAEMKFQQLQFETDQADSESLYNAGRDDLAGLAAAQDAAAKDRSDAFLDNLPPGVRAEMEPRVMAARRSRFGSNLANQRQQQTALSIQDHERMDIQFSQTASTLTTVEELSDLGFAGIERVRNDPNLSQAQKEAHYQRFAGDISKAYLSGKMDRGEDISGDLADIKAGAKQSPMLSLIDRREGAGNYDTLLGHSQKAGGKFSNVKVSTKTIGWLKGFTKGGGNYANWSRTQVKRLRTEDTFATPMGRYQIVGSTMADAAEKMGLSDDTVFTKEVQDAMFQHLIKKRLGKAKTASGKRAQLRAEWDGFNKVEDPDLDDAIRAFETGRGGGSPMFTALSPEELGVYQEKNRAIQSVKRAYEAGNSAYEKHTELGVPGGFDNALEAIRKNKKLTPEEKTSASQIVRQRKVDADNADTAKLKEVRSDFYDKALNLPTADMPGHSEAKKDLISKVAGSDLPPDSKTALKQYITNGAVKESDQSTLFKLEMMRYKKEPEFATYDLSADIHDLSVADFKRLAADQALSVKKYTDPTKVDNVDPVKSKVARAVTAMKIKKEDAEAKVEIAIWKIVGPQIEAYKKEHNTDNAPDAVIQKFVDNATMSVLEHEGMFTDTTFGLEEMIPLFVKGAKKIPGMTSEALQDKAIAGITAWNRSQRKKGLPLAEYNADSMRAWLDQYIAARSNRVERAKKEVKTRSVKPTKTDPAQQKRFDESNAALEEAMKKKFGGTK